MHRIYTTCAIALTLLFSVASANTSHAQAQARTSAVRQEAKLVVHSAALGLGGILANIPDLDAQVATLKQYVHPVRFFEDQSGYFFIYDTHGTCIAHGLQPDLEGSNLFDYKDSEGSSVIKEVIDLARKGGGYLEYNWEKPDREGTFLKLGYVESIPGTPFIIGSGIYLPTP